MLPPDEMHTPAERASLERIRALSLRNRLLDVLVECFDLEELRTLCSHVGIDYEILRGEGKEGKARELVLYAERRGRTPELERVLRLERPHVWENQTDDGARNLPLANVNSCIQKLVAALRDYKQVKKLETRRFACDFLGVHEGILTLDAVAIVKADSLDRDRIAKLHLDFFAFLGAWRPSLFLKRTLKKNGLLCFLFESPCMVEDILYILEQKKDSETNGLGIVDTALTVSWVLDLASRQIYTHDLLVAVGPPVMALRNHVYPGKEFLEGFIRGC